MMNIIYYLKKHSGVLFFNYFFYYYLHLRHAIIPKKLNLQNPETFNEKIIWLKNFIRIPNASVLVDKYLVRDFVERKIGKNHLIPIIGVFDNPNEIDFNKLPESFVLKVNHGSGFNIIVKEKSSLDIDKAIIQLGKWLKVDYYQIGKEYQYKGIVPKIICEKYLEDSSRNPPIDYKFFCFSGEPAFVQVDIDRFTNHTRNFYDLNWQLLPFTTLYPLGTRILPKPEHLSEMIEISKILSAGLIFSRIDLYNLDGRVYFGEITLHHGGGFEPVYPKIYNQILGKYIVLPKVLE